MAGSFYDQIAANRRNSFLMAAFVVVLLGLLGFAIGFAVSGEPAGGVAVTVGAVVLGSLAGIGTYFAGDSLVLSVSGAREVDEAVAPQLMNVVREMAIAANVPMPRVYLIEDTAPNAFATGRDPKHASVAISTGLLEKLDREELQGVIAHELSHVRNLDIRFSLIVGVMVGAIAILADFFLRFTFWGGGSRGRDRDSGGGGGAQTIVFIIAIVLAILAPLISRFIQLAVNRQREYLADASAVELSRNPYGLERALAKIAADTEVLEVANRGTQHMYFTNPIKKFEERASGLMSTHPPIIDRINRLASAHRRRRHWARRNRRNSPVWSRGGLAWQAPEGPWYPALRRRAANAVGHRAEVAQSVEHATENRGVASSILALGTTFRGGRPPGGSGSVGRASPCQGEGRGFESRLPLHSSSPKAPLPLRLVVGQRTLDP